MKFEQLLILEDHRRSGKTFRILMEMLLNASKGETVYYTSDKFRVVEWAFNSCCDITRCYFKNFNDLAYNLKQQSIIFPNGGEIIFKTYKRDNFRGINDKIYAEMSYDFLDKGGLYE